MRRALSPFFARRAIILLMRSAIIHKSSYHYLISLFARTPRLPTGARAVALYNKGEYRAALAEFQDITQERPDAAGAWYYVGLCEFKLKRYDRVELPLARAIDLLEVQSPQSQEIAGAWYTIGLSHYLSNQFDRAIDPLKRYIELTTKAKRELDPSARIALGRAYYSLERFDEALPLLAASAAAAKESKDAAANSYYVGVIHFKREDDDRAIAALAPGRAP